MDPLLLSRLQFGITTVYHFFFVPLTIGLSLMVALMETIYVRSGNPLYKRMTKFWGKLFVINFAMGVVTGIVQEFQFGMNWSEYSRFVGDIFGAPLAIEALLAFFVESVFIGIWIFGWDKLSKGLHAAAIWLVAIASTISAYWILVANSFMQQPVGYSIEGGRAVMTDFFALIFNPNVWVQFPHTVSAAFVTSAFFVLGISAYHLLRNSSPELFKRSFQIAAIIGSISVLILGLNGHSQAQHMIESQPMKMAAAEALWNTESPASFSILTIGDLAQRSEVFSIRLPGLLCLLSYNNLDCEIQGVYDLQAQYEAEFGPGDYIPPVGVVYWAFRIMVGSGTLMIGLALYALFMVMGETLENRGLSLKIYLWAMALPFLANSFGWILAEMGRMPWIVYTLMKVDQGLSITVPPVQMLITLLGFTLVYAALIVATIYLMAKFAKIVPAEQEGSTSDSDEDAPALVPASD
jgi:cytochrome d ubiquinol oxidase subunit I